MKNKLKHIVLIISATLTYACSQKTSTTSIKKDRTNFMKATIINLKLDGCSWMLVLEDGRKLEPINMQEEFKKENLPVWIKYETHNGMSICMAGEMVKITAIEKRDLQ